MKLLLDTHVLLWSATDPDRLSTDARAALEDGSHDVLVSVVSAWEIAIKQSLGKLELPTPAEEWLPEVLRRSGFEVAELGLAAALRVRSLAWHHRDPFDRLLVAQAFEEGYTLVTHDDDLAAYGVPVLRA
ncbi:MAG: type II toxin-antitoxin system VapC family toxin [Deltaproteobacteria bacterium]|nr:type II toxin-antitoxin system VapC family toxin [Deltaproteobacteria bacterium]MDQ3300360.1 type II toxin-antitoxin system VapC family toxin [Myxococcota bacterium]